MQKTRLGRIDGVVLGTLVDFDAEGRPRVDYAPNPGDDPRPAAATARLRRRDAGRAVALVFEHGDPRRPVILGLMREPDPEPDDDRRVLTAEREIVLRCGKASLTLTREGKVILRGAYLLSRSSGVNRIQGGSVQIN